MKSLQSRSRFSTVIEPLEARIAPAALIVKAGAPDNTNINDSDYVDDGDNNFINTEGSTDSISLAVGGGEIGVADTFYLKLTAGSKLQVYNEQNSFGDFIVVRSGTVVAFFEDKPNANGVRNNEVDADELTGLSLSRGAVVEVNGSIYGDVVTNLKADGTLDMSPGAGGLVAPTQTIGSLSVGSAIFGGVYSGGAINRLTVNGNVDEVLAGTAANGVTFDFFPDAPGGSATLTVTAAPAQTGPSISNVRVDSVTGAIAAGGGGAGGLGGSLVNVQVIEDVDGLVLRAGDGGAGISTRINGGGGGSLINVSVLAASDSAASPASIELIAGDGGDALNTGVGGRGGQVLNSSVGYLIVNGRLDIAQVKLLDRVEVNSGDGGDGRVGGAGGVISGLKVAVAAPDEIGSAEIEVIAGSGGNALNAAGGAGGLGGAIVNADLRNFDLLSFNNPDTDVLLQAGSGGIGNAVANGARGGSITNSSLLGYDLQILAGNGSDGRTAGSGGTVTKTTFVQDETIIAHNLTVNAGFGGNSTVGRGGLGGGINGILLTGADLTNLTINGGSAANGGNSAGGLGGNGGAVQGLNITDSDLASARGLFTIRSGDGGDGKLGGSFGGRIFNLGLIAQDAEIIVDGGDGGDALERGRGGAGGALGTMSINSLRSVGDFNATFVSGLIQAGAGGSGAGTAGAGGAGGEIRTVFVNVDGNVVMEAGDGGNAAGNAAAGRGGSVLFSGAFADFGSGVLRAGDAGTEGLRAAAGGNIVGSATVPSGLRAAEGLTLVAGNGSHGGIGGDILNVTFGSTSSSLRPTPNGNVLIQAGNGSAEGAVAGRGGNISGVQGSVSSGVGKTTDFLAGDGGGSDRASGAGGSILNSGLNLGGALDGVIVIQAGDAGDSANALTGARGGSLRDFRVSNIDEAVLLRSVGAGDGGDALRRGGLGGSVAAVRVGDHDIGVRTGEVFGYSTMGGVFAGEGGTGAVRGLAGNVTDISANAISSIVAGRSAAPQLVERVERITLNGLDALKLALPEGFTISINGETTQALPSSATLQQVENAVNALPYVAAQGGADVTRTDDNTFLIAFRAPGDQPEFSAEELIPVAVDTEVEGVTVLEVDEVRPGTGIISEVQRIAPLADGTFVLQFQGETTLPLSSTATAVEVDAALDALQSIQDAGGVDVADAPGGGFDVTFTEVGARESILGEATRQEVQIVDILSGSGPFVLSYNGFNTARLSNEATAAEVEAELDAIVPGGVTVTEDPTPGPGMEGRYTVTFDAPGAQTEITGTQFDALPQNNFTQGTATVAEVQGINYEVRERISPEDYAAANLVGAIANINEIGAQRFRWIESGVPNGKFDLGETPIDGLVMAKFFNRNAPTNFVPEALFNGVTLIDNQNAR